MLLLLVVVQLISHICLFETPWTAGHEAFLSSAISESLLKLRSIELMMPSNHLVICYPLLLLPSIFPNIRVFSIESPLHIRWPKYELQLQHQSFQWLFRVDFLWIDWFDLLSVQGTIRSLLQHQSLKASILWRSAFFMVQLSHLYMTTGKTIALTVQIFVSKVMSLLFNMLSRLVRAFLPRIKHLLISWLQSQICSDFGAPQK